MTPILASNILLIAFIVLQVLDVFTTYKTLSGNKGIEANPIMKFLISKLGLTFGLLIPKFIVIGLVVLTYELMSPYILLGLVILYIGIIINNFWILNKK